MRWLFREATTSFSPPRSLSFTSSKILRGITYETADV
jgi:hypothetical protein